MRTMLFALLIACGGGSKPAPQPPIANTAPAPPPADAPPPDPMAEVIVAMHRFSDDMCKCKDSACAQMVSDQMTKWAQRMASDGKQKSVQPTEEQTKEITAVTKTMIDCMNRVMPAAGNQPPP